MKICVDTQAPAYVLILSLFTASAMALGAQLPQLTDVRGFLQHREGPIDSFIENLADIPHMHPESTFLNPQADPDGAIYRADYRFDESELIVYYFENDIDGSYPWRVQTQLCAGRTLGLLTDIDYLGIMFQQSDADYFVLVKDTDMDICSFIDTFLPLQNFFNSGRSSLPSPRPPQFPGALGRLP